MINQELKSYDVVSINRFGYRNIVLDNVGRSEADKFLERMGDFYSQLIVEENKQE